MKTAVASLVALLLAATASAQTLASVGLHDTGTLVGTRNPYSLLSAPAGATYALYVPNQNVWPLNDVWLDNTNSTKWLAVYRTGQWLNGNVPSVEPGTYTIRLSFDLGTYNPAAVSIGFAAAADNNLAVRLNGSLLTNTGTPESDGRNYGDLGNYIYSINGTGLLAGMNVLEFDLTNLSGATSNPAGLYVDFNSFTVVPEPAAYALCLGGATLFLAAVKRRRFC